MIEVKGITQGGRQPNPLAHAYISLLKALIALSLALMVVLVFGNVVLRYAFNQGITLSEELSRWLFVYLTFLGAIVAMYERGHLGVDALVRRLPRLGRIGCLLVSQVLMLFAATVLMWGSLRQTEINLDVHAPISGLSMGLFYGIGVVFSGSVIVILLSDMWHVLSGRLTDEELVMVKESEEQEEVEELTRAMARNGARENSAPMRKQETT